MIPKNPQRLFRKMMLCSMTAQFEHMMESRGSMMKKIILPKEIKAFMGKYPSKVTHEWQDKLLKSSVDMSIDELKWYLDNMPPMHFCRAEIRAVYNDRLKKEAEKADIKDKLYLIMPHEHGNGGWCGWETLAHVATDFILKRNPVTIYLAGYYDPMFGSQLRLCKTENPNDAVYLFDHEENVWLNSSGYKMENNDAKK